MASFFTMGAEACVAAVLQGVGYVSQDAETTMAFVVALLFVATLYPASMFSSGRGAELRQRIAVGFVAGVTGVSDWDVGAVGSALSVLDDHVTSSDSQAGRRLRSALRESGSGIFCNGGTDTPTRHIFHAVGSRVSCAPRASPSSR